MTQTKKCKKTPTPCHSSSSSSPVSGTRERDLKKVPTLRFGEFSGEWEEKKLGDLLDYEQPTNYIVNSTEYDNNYETPVLTAGKSFILGYTDEKENIFSSKKLPVIIFDDFTTATKFVNFPFKVKSSAMKILKSKKNVNMRLVYEIMQLIDYEVGGHGRHWISKFSNLKINIPQKEEQKKIADFLGGVDAWVDNLVEQKTKLEKYKKGIMQLMLNCEPSIVNGKKVYAPKLRFPNFSDTWEEKKVKDIFELTRGYVLPIKDMKQQKDAKYRYPIYSSQTKNNGLIGYYNEYLYENALTWTTDGANAGKVDYRREKFYCTNVSGVLISEERYANQCVAEILNLITKKYVSYVGNPKLMNNVMASIKISIPSLPEQKKIADFLSSIDDMIELKDKQIKNAKKWKKGLMQGLFV